MRIALITVVVAALASSALIGGQTPPAEESLSVPDGDGAWTIRITTGGGFTGRGRGNVTLTSQGTLTCLQTLRPCDNKLVDDKLRPIAQLVSSFDPSKWASERPASNSLCNDCYTTTVTFARREGGKLKVATLSWDDTTQSKMPPDLVKIAETALLGKW